MILYEIAVKYVQMRREFGQQYGMELEWKTKQSGDTVCKGPFFLLLYVEDIFQGAYPIERKEGVYGAGSVHGLTDIPAGRKTVKVGVTQRPEDARWYPAVPLVAEVYENVRAVYGNNGLSVRWNALENSSLEAMLSLKKEGSSLEKQFLISGESLETVLSFSLEQDSFSLSLYARKGLEGGVESLGAAEEIWIPGIWPILCSVDRQEQMITVNYSLQGSLKEAADKVSLWVEVSSGEKVRYRTEEFVPQKEERCSYCFSVPQESYWEPDACRLSLYYRIGSFCYERQGEENSIPLSVPRLRVSVGRKGESLVKWERADASDAFLVIVTQEEIEAPRNQIVGQREMVFAPEEAEGKTMAVASLYGTSRIRGPYSTSLKLVPEGFYADQALPGQLRYCRKREGTVSFSVNEELFDDTLPEAVTTGPFSLAAGPDWYTVSLDFGGKFTYDYLQEWLKELLAQGITPLGYYSVRNLAARLSPLEGAQMLPYYCSALKNGLSMEVLPGFQLHMENEYYIRQENDPQGAGGFVRGAFGEYSVSLECQGKDAVLEMNSLFSHVVGNWTDGAWRSYPYPASGMMDFFLAPLRSAYYRLCYPKSFLKGEHPGNNYAGDNICLMALAPCVPVPDCLDDTDFPGIVLRGRTAVTVNLEVFVNQTPVAVPVGTTLGKLLSRYAADPSSVRLFRRTGWPEGRFLPIYLGEAAQDRAFVDAMVLLAGDKIEV